MITPDFSETLGVNSQKQLTELETIFYNKIKQNWLVNGVMIENPDTVIVGESVILQNDTNIRANTHIKGNSQILKGAKIGPNSLIINSKIGKNAILKGHNIVINSTVKDEEILDYLEKRL